MQEELDRAIHTIHLRFGGSALTPARSLPASEPWPTTIEALDRLSGIGGLPRGRIAALTGRCTSGKTSVALALLARATREFAHAVVIDPGFGFDPWTLMALEADLATLTAVRPPTPAATGEAATSLARAGVGFLLIALFGRGAAEVESWTSPLAAAAERSGAIVLTLAETLPAALAYASSLTLGLERTGWIWERDQLVGIRSRASCLKNKVGIPSAPAELEIRHPLGAGLFSARPLREVAEDPLEATRWDSSAVV